MTAPATAPRAETGFPTELATRCVLLLVLGVVALALRVASVFLPRASLTVLILLFGGFAVADGVASGAIGLWRVRRKRAAAAMFLRAALGIGVGALALATDMAAGAAVAVLSRMSRLFELWAFVSGGLDLAVAGAVSVAVAVMLAVRSPIGIPLLVLWVGGYAIVVGILLLVRVIRLA
jgi:uncharacterized membrane protein HdeD (DUF308 family)